MANLDKKSKYYSYILYPENYPDNEYLYKLLDDDLMLDYLLSPVHSPSEDLKKHFHLLTVYPNPIGLSSAQRVGERLNSAKKVIFGFNPISAARYLIHLDNPEKEQFDQKDIRVHGLLAKSLSDKAFSDNELFRVAATFRSIHNYVLDHHITDIHVLQQYLLGTDFSSFQLVQQNYIYFNDLCRTQFGMHIDDTVNLD